MSNVLLTALSSAVGTVQKDAVLNFLPVLNGFLTNIQANPSQENLVAQGMLVEPQLIAALPDFEAAAVKDLAAQIQAMLNAYATSLTTAITSPPAAVPTGTSAPATPTPVVVTSA